MKQIAVLMTFMLAALAVFALIIRIVAALSGHCCGGMAFVVAANGTPGVVSAAGRAFRRVDLPRFGGRP
jgi:hypothetical protein